MLRFLSSYTLLVAALFAAACDRPAAELEAGAFGPMLAEIDSATLATHIAYLADDALEGRAPGTPGESLAVAYIRDQMQAAGLVGGAPDGGFFQTVPLLGSTPSPRGALSFESADGARAELTFVDDYIASTDLEATSVTVDDAPLVFAGYGVDAPGYDWDDYKGVDVTDKVLVLFVNDPVASDEEPGLFQADTLTYYGRWTYKYEEARRRGAAGVLLIHTLGTAGYPFTVLSGTAASEQIQLAEPPENPLGLKGWLTREAADRLARMAGSSLDAWFAQANSRSFEPQPLPVTVSSTIDYAVRRFEGTNVIGKLAGESDEAVLYSAHHDHLGVGAPDSTGDAIYNGAVDNATGVAMLLTLAEAFSAAPETPARSVYFASVTAEESGLLGAEYFARNPSLPMADIAGNINVDSGNIYGETEDIVGIGAERSEMLDLLAEAAAAEGLEVTADPQPGQGLFFRSDQLAFAREGVPGVFINTGRRFAGQGDDYFDRVAGRYRMENYHKPGDEYDPAWPLGGMVQQTRVAFRMGYALATTDRVLKWNEGEAFAQARAEGPVQEAAPVR